MEPFARYRMLRRLGGGGMAEVFRAELEGAEGVTRELVIKRMHHRLAQDPEAVRMFIAEARIAARLSHPNVVQVYEFGRAGEDYFLAMELIEGCDLATLARSWRGHPAPMGITAWVLNELLEALAYVHGLADERGAPLGLVHRDVSPHNVLVGVAGEVKLADFGIAQAAAALDAGEGARVKGKLAFMAPEQARGDALDARADLFGAGAILYELLAGERPFETVDGTTPPEAVRAGAVIPIRARAPWLSEELCAVVDRATAPRREDRFPDAATFRDALRDAFAEDAVVADRAMLRSAVRAALEAKSPAPRAEPTATADVPAPEPVTAEPVATAPSPSPRPRARLLLERAVIAVAVFVVAVLAERRTRPPQRARPAVVEPVVTVGPARLLRGLGAGERARVARTCGARIAVAEGVAGASVAVLGWSDLAGAQGDWSILSAAFEPSERARFARVERALGLSGASELAARFAPFAVDPVVFFARREALAALSSTRATGASALRDRYREALGAAPRDVRVPAADLDAWSAWDVFAAAVALRAAGGAARVWIPAGDTEVAAATWTARAVAHDPDAARDLTASEGPATVLGWDRALHSADLLAIGADLSDDDLTPPPDATVAFGWSPLSRMRRARLDGWRVARLPRGDDWYLDARGEPARLGARVVPAEVYGWALRADAGSSERCVFQALARAEVEYSIRDGSGWSPVGGAPAWVAPALEPALRADLDAARLAVIRDGAPRAPRRAAWWSLWRAAVLTGAADGALGPAWREATTARARAALTARAPTTERW